MPSSSHSRSGTALLVTLVICAGFAVLAIAASERMFGMKKLTGVDLARQRAEASADAVAAMVESRLMDAAADYSKLVKSVDTDVDLATHPWWKLKGCVYRGADGTLHGPGFDDDAEGLWINGCLVRWMIEPVRLYSKAWSTAPAGDAEYVVNPPRDPSESNQWEAAAQIGANGEAMPGTHNRDVADFYHFRVVAQSYALSNPANTTAQPWTNDGSQVAAAQSLRVLQVQSLQLFKYALFYAAPSPVGDLDLQTGSMIWVQKGAVHSNGAIYIRGGESSGFNQKNWHVMASGDGGVDQENAGQSIFLGEADRPITITGVAGIYRLNKTGNNLAANHNLFMQTGQGAPVRMNPLRPFDIPTAANRFTNDDLSSGGSRLDLNGDQDNSRRHQFNGIPFTRANDSRSPQEFVKAFANYARDGNNGGKFVRTLQNIPELGGRPFEPQALVSTVGGVPNLLYGSPTGNALQLISRNRTRRDSGGNLVTLVPLHYPNDPTGASGRVSRPATRPYLGLQPVARVPSGGRPVLAEEMRLWWDPTFSSNDILNPTQEIVLRDQIPAHAATLPTNAQDFGDDGDYRLGDSAADRERPAYFVGTTLTIPTWAPPTTTSTLSFPGVPLVIPPGYTNTGTVWQPGFYGTGYSPREVKGHYLEAALFGELPVAGSLSKQQQYYQSAQASPGIAPSISKTGIVIRERRWQQRPRERSMRVLQLNGTHTPGNENVTAWNNYWPGGWLPGSTADLLANDPSNPDSDAYLNPSDSTAADQAKAVRPIRRPTLSAAPTAQEKLDYVQYLCSQYVVLFCGRNITAPFFGQILSATDVRDFIVTEDEFVDPRESGYMWGMYGATGDATGTFAPGATYPQENATDDFYQYRFFAEPQPPTYPVVAGTTTTQNFRQNVLTVHMRAFQFWLRDTPMTDLGYAGDANTANSRFTGVLYCHRARRSDTMHPLLSPELDWPGFDRIAWNVESDPGRLSTGQTHFRAYWFTEVTRRDAVTGIPTPPGMAGYPQETNDVAAEPIIYPPINFPWNWREPSGPLETTRLATRLRGQLNDPLESDPTYYRVFWNHSSPTSTTDKLGTSGFTYITPQRFYLWGNFAYVVNNLTNETAGRADIDANISRITPCAVFADNYTMQSVNWRDENSQSLPTSAFGTPPGLAGSTCQFTAMVINNSPNARWNCGSFGAAGQEGTFRMIENWGYDQTHFWWSGSQVVMNMGRYHHSGHNHLPRDRSVARAQAPAHMGVGAFHTSTNHYIFNTNLFTRDGRPPLAPSGVNATRVVNQITHFGQ